jgi:tRNA-2-methylthio-N6-dimethylallyladenosine synthase
MLRRMKRLYTVAQYDEMMARIRETVPDCAVSSDFIVGFCGETEESFEKTVELVKRSRFKNSFIFKYSPRRGTKAFELYADDVPEEVKKRRNNDLLAVQSAISQADNQAFVGQEYEVLVEGPSKSFSGDIATVSGPVQLTGRTMTDRICVFDGNTRLIGAYSKVRVVSASSVTLFAEVVTDHRTTHGRPAEWSLPVIS